MSRSLICGLAVALLFAVGSLADAGFGHRNRDADLGFTLRQHTGEHEEDQQQEHHVNHRRNQHADRGLFDFLGKIHGDLPFRRPDQAGITSPS